MLQAYLATSPELGNIDNMVSKSTKEELNQSSDKMSCIVAIVNNEKIPADLKLKVIQKLVSVGLNLKKADPSGQALLYFSQRNAPQAISYLLDQGADINLDGNIILRQACWEGLFANIKGIVEKASPGYVDNDNYTAFALLIRGFIRDVQSADNNKEKDEIQKQYTKTFELMLKNSKSPVDAATVALWYLMAFGEYDDHVLKLSERLSRIGANPYILIKDRKGDVTAQLCAADYNKDIKYKTWIQTVDHIVEENVQNPSSEKTILSPEEAKKVYQDMLAHQAKRKNQ